MPVKPTRVIVFFSLAALTITSYLGLRVSNKASAVETVGRYVVLTETFARGVIGAAKNLPKRKSIRNTPDQDTLMDDELMRAVCGGDEIAVRSLLAEHARPSGAPDMSPLHPATRSTNINILSALIEAGGNPANTYKGETPLYEAALIGNKEAIALLLTSHADINKGDVVGVTPAMAAASVERWGVVLSLLESGASVSIGSGANLSLPKLAYNSRIRPGSIEHSNLQTVIARIRNSGLDWPPPTFAVVKSARSEEP